MRSREAHKHPSRLSQPIKTGLATRLAAVATLLLFAPVAQADWLQPGHDAARSGYAEGDAPEWPDVLAVVPVAWDGAAYDPHAVRLVEETLYFLAQGPDDCRGAFFRLALEDLLLERLACYPRAPLDVVSDGDILVVTYNERPELVIGIQFRMTAVAYDLDGAELWSTPIFPGAHEVSAESEQVDQITYLWCRTSVIHDDQFIAACSDDASQVWLVRRSLDTGTLLGATLISGANVDSGGDDAAQDPATWAFRYYDDVTPPPVVATAISVIGNQALVSVIFTDALGGVESTPFHGTAVLAASRIDGMGQWKFSPFSESDQFDREWPYMPPVVGEPGQLYALTAWDAISEMSVLDDGGRYSGYVNVGQEIGVDLVYGPNGPVIAGQEFLIAAFPEHHLGTFERFPRWKSALPAGHQFQASCLGCDRIEQIGDLILAGDAIIALTIDGTGTEWFHRFDALSGELVWSWPAPGAGPGIVDGGLFAFPDQQSIVIMGNGPGALQATAAPSTSYPAPGVPVSVDFSKSKAGMGGPATEVWIDWGDGTVDGWSDGNNPSHIYNAVGTATARFQIRNDAGQTSTVLHTFHVGVPDPSETFLDRAFSPENQETTYFLLGLLATALFAGFGFARLARRRGILQRELRTLEALQIELKGDPMAVDSELRARRTHARDLYLGHKMDEGQYAILERRIDEMAGQVRMSSLDTDFEFLPMGLGRLIQTMLRDGRISVAERTQLAKVIDAEKRLTTPEKRKVHALVQDWFSRDHGTAS